MEGKYFKFIAIDKYQNYDSLDNVRLVHCNALDINGNKNTTGLVFYNPSGNDGVIVGLDHRTKRLIIRDSNGDVVLKDQTQQYLNEIKLTKISADINFIEDTEEIKKMNSYVKKINSYKRKIEECAEKSIEKINEDFKKDDEESEEDTEISNPTKKLKPNK